MAEQLTGPKGAPITVDADEQKFAAAMSTPEPGAPLDRPPPARRDPAAPHGRNDDGSPKAPFGYKGDGTPRVSAPGPGRGKTGSQPGARVQRQADPKPAASGAAESAEDARARRAADATATLELLSGAGTLYAMFSLTRAGAAYKAAEAKGDKAAKERAETAYNRAQVMQLDAATCALHADPCGASAAQAAQTNRYAAALVDRLALFNGVASVTMAFLPMIYQFVANHAPTEAKDNFPPELMALGVLPPKLLLEKLEAQNAVKMANAQASILAEKEAALAELDALRESAAA
jgi:hypothetical protein